MQITTLTTPGFLSLDKLWLFSTPFTSLAPAWPPGDWGLQLLSTQDRHSLWFPTLLFQPWHGQGPQMEPYGLPKLPASAGSRLVGTCPVPARGNMALTWVILLVISYLM